MTSIIPITPSTIENAVHADPQLHSAHSRRQYISVLGTFDNWRAGRPVTVTLVKAYLADLQEQGLSPATINQKLSAIKWWARTMATWAGDFGTPEQAGQIAEQAARIASIRSVKGERQVTGRHLGADEIRALLDASENTRDRALLAVLFVTGMRQAEIRALSMGDVADEGDHYQLTVQGKGNKVRTAYVHNGARLVLEAWLAERGDAPGAVFCPFVRGGAPAHARHLSHEGLRKIIQAHVERAGLEHLTPHDFRRTFAGNLLDQEDIATVQALLGHASPTTTVRYDRRGEERKRTASAKITLPE